MKKSLGLTGILALFAILALALLIAQYWADWKEMASMVAGYLLFALNYLALRSIGRALILITLSGGGNARKIKLWLCLGSLGKFLGLIGALYIFLVVFKCAGFYLAFGSLLSLLVVTGLQVSTYLSSLKNA
ncbi:MAG: hypothetical protein NTX25_17510 [Proteobacteria bacterium]|nr:hypothetical protein [Pseudomonadota bacterium]